jgi:MFS family permease
VRAPVLALVLLCAAQFMVILDVTVVNVALPSIGTALSFAATDLQWVVTVYVLFTGGLMLLGGRATDMLGRRRVFLVGLLVFTAASLASGLAWSPAALIVARAAQGFGAALLLPSALAIITTTYGGGQRTVALSIWGAIAAPASPRASCLGASSRRCLVGSGSSSSTSRLGSSSRPAPSGYCPGSRRSPQRA